MPSDCNRRCGSWPRLRRCPGKYVRSPRPAASPHSSESCGRSNGWNTSSARRRKNSPHAPRHEPRRGPADDHGSGPHLPVCRPPAAPFPRRHLARALHRSGGGGRRDRPRRLRQRRTARDGTRRRCGVARAARPDGPGGAIPQGARAHPHPGAGGANPPDPHRAATARSSCDGPDGCRCRCPSRSTSAPSPVVASLQGRERELLELREAAAKAEQALREAQIAANVTPIIRGGGRPTSGQPLRADGPDRRVGCERHRPGCRVAPPSRGRLAPVRNLAAPVTSSSRRKFLARRAATGAASPLRTSDLRRGDNVARQSGAMAQLVARFVRIEEVRGSNPLSSTM